MNQWLKNQGQNMFLYAPFLMAGGAAVYFTMMTEPNIPYYGLITSVLMVGMFVQKFPTIIRAILIFLFGFMWALTYTNITDTPQLKRNLYNHTIDGRVYSVDYTPDKVRLYLDDGNMRVRVSVQDNSPIPNIGDRIRANVSLFRPGPASAPETFDWARWAYFHKLSATGAVQNIENTSPSPRINIRELIHKKSNSFLVDSLVLGYKHTIPKHDDAIWTNVGVGHIWSISGFHMTLVGGWIFAIFYLIFRSIPYITRRIPARKPALGCAWLCLIAYLFISGCDVATLRAFGMTTLMFAAFICGRSAFSMRNVALIFCGLFLINPHNVMHAGFQLSFAAVFGLVWMFSVVKPRMPQNKILLVIYASGLTSVVATVFTMPFVAAHFGTLPTYSMIGNLVLLPIFSIAIMPLVLVGAILPGVELVELSHTIYNHALKIAEYIAGLPMATIDVGHISNAAMMCFIVGFMCLILIRDEKYKINLLGFSGFVICGMLCVSLSPRPIFMSTHDNELVAFVGENNKLEFNKSRASNHYFAFDTWKELNNQETNTPNPRRKHVDGIYRYDTENFNLVYIQKFVPLMKNIATLCADDDVDYIVSYWNINSKMCKYKILRGGFIIYPSGRIKRTPTNRRWHQ